MNTRSKIIYQSLSLPDDLAIFNWHDKFHKVPDALKEPVFVSSTRKVIDGREYDCDQYESKIENAADGQSATIIFEPCYMNGELALAQSALSANGKEYEINRLVVKKILPSIPSGDFKLNGKEKIHSAGGGDMNDLLEDVELYGKNGLIIENNSFFLNRPLSGESFGDANFTEMMNAIKYKFAASGTLPNGLRL